MNISRQNSTGILRSVLVIILVVSVVTIISQSVSAPNSPDFTILVSQTSLTIKQRTSCKSTINITSISGFNGTISLSVSESPAGVSATFIPTEVTLLSNGSVTSILNVYVDPSATPGNCTLKVNGTSGNVTHTVDVNLTALASARAPEPVFPLRPWDISIWIAVTAIILLVTSELIGPYSEYFGDFVIEKKRLRLAALVLGAAFMVAVILIVVTS